MYAHDFLRLVLPAQGWFIGFAKKGTLRRQWVFESIDELIDTLFRINAQGWDAYHAVATYREQHGLWNEHKKKVELRCHANVLWLRSLIADIDTRGSKPNAKYADREEAWNAVVAFCREQAQIPLPLFVASGGGLHCYWPLEALMDLRAFKLLAGNLKRAFAHFRLAADPVRTADASSILRTPGTHHHKTGRLVECGEFAGPYKLEDFGSLGRFNEHQSRSNQRPDRQNQPLAAAASNMYGDSACDPNDIRRACQQVKHFGNDPGAFSEPIHYAMAGLFSNCGPDGPDFYLSLLAPEWRAAGAAKAKQWQAATTGPPTCQHFESLNPQGCAGCPHKGKITSPIVLGRGYINVEPKIKTFEKIEGAPFLPPPWQWSETGQLILQEEDNRGNPIQTVISEYPIFLAGVSAGETVGNVSYIFQQWLPYHGWRDISIKASRIFGLNGVYDLADSGAVVREPKRFIAYVHDALAAWHKDHRMSQSYEQCGWKENETRFLVGTDLYTPDGVTSPVVTNDELRARVKLGLKPTENGDVRKWTQAANKLLGNTSPACYFAVLASFAAPLMRLHTRHEGGALVSLVNRLSGTGKTTTLEIAASVWGDLQSLSISSIDTQASRGLTFAALGNLPVIFDEMALIASGDHPERLRDFVMAVSNGKDRMRAEQSGRGIIHTQRTWQTLLITASNLSIVDLLENFDDGIDAPAYRILELKVDYPQHFDYASGDRLKAELFEHAGHAGRAYIQHLLQPEVFDFTKKALLQWTDEIWRQTEWKPQHRFWARTAGAICVAGELVRSLGLLRVDPHEVMSWAVRELQKRVSPTTGQQEKGQEGVDAVAVLGEYLAKYQDHILAVRLPWRPGDVPMEPLTRPRGDLVIRYETSTGRLSTRSREWRRWLVGRGYSYTDVMNALEESKVLTNSKRMVTLGAGTIIPSAPVACVEFNMEHPLVDGVAREVVEKVANVAKI